MADAPSTATSTTVLIVEDDRAVREMLATVLTREGLDVQTADDGLEGLLKIGIHAPALVLLDIMMPDVGGMRVLDQLAAEHADVPVVVITGKPEAARLARVRLGAANVFDKPFDIDDLLARIAAILGRP